MDFTRSLYEENMDYFSAYMSHPFIRGIEKGDLELDKFKFYLVQDYIYLWDYAKLFALGALKSEDRSLIAHFSKSLDYTINGEMDIHRAYMKDLGISEEESEGAEVSMINLSYTNYMLSLAQKGGYEEVITVLLSCAWTYQEIAKWIDEKNPSAKDHPFYGRWLRGYLERDYQDTANFYRKEMDEIGKGLKSQRKAYLSQAFRTCCKFELYFWDMAYKKAYSFKDL